MNVSRITAVKLGRYPGSLTMICMVSLPSHVAKIAKTQWRKKENVCVHTEFTVAGAASDFTDFPFNP